MASDEPKGRRGANGSVKIDTSMLEERTRR
jgi:hypothetical protein